MKSNLKNLWKTLITKDPVKVAKTTSCIGIFLLTSLTLIGIPLNTAILITLTEVALPPTYLYLNPRYKEKKRSREMEKELIPSLYYASSVAHYSDTHEVMRKLSKGKDSLSREFRRAHLDVKNGSSVKKSLESMKERINSDLVKRAISMMIMGHETGADLSSALEEIAEEASQAAEINRERRVSSTIEKYTLLLAGGIIVPILLGSLTSVINSLELGPIITIGLGLPEAVKESVKNNTLIGNQVYICLYSITASLFVAYQEKEIEKALLYIAILLPLSLLLFNTMRKINLLQLL